MLIIFLHAHLAFVSLLSFHTDIFHSKTKFTQLQLQVNKTNWNYLLMHSYLVSGIYRLSYTCFISLLETKKVWYTGISNIHPCTLSSLRSHHSHIKTEASNFLPNSMENIVFYTAFSGAQELSFPPELPAQVSSCDEYIMKVLTLELSVSSPALPLTLFWEQIVQSDRAQLNTSKIDLLLFSTITGLSEMLKGTPNVWTMLKLQNFPPIFQLPVFN